MNPSKEQSQRQIRNFCKPYEHLYLTPEGQLIEVFNSGYTLISGVELYSTGIEFSGTVIKHYPSNK